MPNINKSFLTKCKHWFVAFALLPACFNFAYSGSAPCSEGNTSGTKFFYKEGVCWAAYCNMGAVVWLGTSSSGCSGSCKPGDVQYQASGMCGQRSRTCCNNADWSDWADGVKGGDCPAPNCSSSECWNGAFCEKLTSNYNPECQRYCDEGSGWRFRRESYTGTYSWEYYRPGGREYSYSGKCAGTVNDSVCSSYISLGNSWAVLENKNNLPGLCKKQPEGFYILSDWRCEDGNRYVGYPNSYTSSGVTKMWCNTGTLKAVKSIVSCTKSTKNC